MRHWRLISAVVLVAASSVVIASQAPSGHAVFEQALAKERVEGNLPEAIRLYERVVAEFASDRALAAKALVQVGLCYEKLGRDESVRAYERLLRDFADQADAVSHAHARLAVLKRGTAAPASRGGITVRELPNVGAYGSELQSVSPDGTKAVVADWTKGFNLAIVDLATGQSRLLTNFDWSQAPSFAFNPVWSRDGQHIAYFHGPNRGNSALELRVMTLDGKPRTIYRNDPATGSSLIPLDWLPDGSAILAIMSRPDGTQTIGLVAIADGKFAQLRTFGWDFSSRDGLRVSPDGRFIAYVERTSGLGDLHVLSINGREAFRITDHPADDRQPIWSPDGRQLAFISNRFGTDALWTVEMENGNPKGEPVKLKDGMNGVNLVGWPDRGLVCQQTIQTSDLFTIPMVPGTTRSAGSRRPLPYARSGWNLAPAWSPDGKSLAFISGSLSDPNKRYLVVMPSPGVVREFLIPSSPSANVNLPNDLRWFGNGRGLGLTGYDVKGRPVVFRLSLSTGEWTTSDSPTEGYATWTEWNDDGTAFYFVRYRGAKQNGILRRSVEDGREEVLYAPTPTDSRIRSLEMSPDRRWLAFQKVVEVKSGVLESQVIVLDVASGERRKVMSLTETDSPDSERLRLSGWSPDGRVLVQHYPARSLSANWLLVPLDGGASQPFTVDIPPAIGTPPSNQALAKWSPDGSAIAFVQPARSWRAFILENPLGDLPAARTSAKRR